MQNKKVKTLLATMCLTATVLSGCGENELNTFNASSENVSLVYGPREYFEETTETETESSSEIESTEEETTEISFSDIMDEIEIKPDLYGPAKFR